MRWIVVDGIDGSGKSSCARWIQDHYEAKGEKVLIRVHPSDRLLGRISRRSLQKEGRAHKLMATVFFVADILGSVRRLRSDAREYATVIYVRYLMATAYLPHRLVSLGYDFFARLLPVPRRLLFVDVPPATALARIEMRSEKREMFEDLASLDKTRRKMLALRDRGWKVVDNSLPPDEVRADLEEILTAWDRAGPD